MDGLEYNKRYILRVNLKEKLDEPGGRVSIFSLNLRVKYIVYCTTNCSIRNLSSTFHFTPNTSLRIYTSLHRLYMFDDVLEQKLRRESSLQIDSKAIDRDVDNASTADR